MSRGVTDFVPRTSGAVRWRDLRTRVASALLLAPVGLYCVWRGGVVFDAMMGLIALGLAAEWRGFGLARPDVSWGRLALAAFAHLAPGVAATIWLRARGPDGRADLLFVVFVVWASDIGAYVVGRLIGGERLAPWISESKTWAGAVGGWLAAIGLGFVAGEALAPGSGAAAMAAAAALGLAAQAGDLLESAIKRYFGVKDSGRLIPGHGGMLDRLDGMLTAVPVAVLFALARGGGGVFWH